MGLVADIHLDGAPGERPDVSPCIEDLPVPGPDANGLDEVDEFKDRKMSFYDERGAAPATQFSFFTSQLSLQPARQVEAVDGTRSSSPNVYAIVFREGVLSFNFGNSPHGGHVRNRIKEHRSHLALTSDWISYALMYVYFIVTSMSDSTG